MVRSDVRAIDKKSHELLSVMTCRTRPEESGRWKMYTHSTNEETLINFYTSSPLTIDFGNGTLVIAGLGGN